MFLNIYKGRRVLVTGHTGFKGSWLTTWLLSLGSDVAGYSLDIPTKPSNFEVLGLMHRIQHIRGDVRDRDSLQRAFDLSKPEVVFHLAAQAITRRSYDIPQETIHTNLMGTVNILECIRKSGSVKAAVIITSDKCYQNVEWIWGYRESDRLGGEDPYSASKACAEIACYSYVKSFFSKDGSPKISTARAGNVIGGGDWAIDRIIPDCVRAFSKEEKLEIRNPKATRPWQYVLEPLSGYLWLSANLLQNNKKLVGEAFNFGPIGDVNRTVEELISAFAKIWGNASWCISDKSNLAKKESTLLKLNCDKALYYLGWRTVLSFEETIEMTANWYKAFYKNKKDMYDFTTEQIEEYTNLARRRGIVWTE